VVVVESGAFVTGAELPELSVLDVVVVPAMVVVVPDVFVTGAEVPELGVLDGVVVPAVPVAMEVVPVLPVEGLPELAGLLELVEVVELLVVPGAFGEAVVPVVLPVPVVADELVVPVLPVEAAVPACFWLNGVRPLPQPMARRVPVSTAAALRRRDLLSEDPGKRHKLHKKHRFLFALLTSAYDVFK